MEQTAEPVNQTIPEKCKAKIHAPYPLFFHKMGFRDIQIGYKIHPICVSLFPAHPLIEALKNVMKEDGHETKDVSEYYDDEDEFANRVKSFLSND